MDPIQISHLKRIQEASHSGRLVLFVGAGVSNNSGVPTWKELIYEMKKELPDSMSDETNELKVAQVYKDIRGEKEYLDKVKEILLYNKVVPNPIHEAVLSLNPVHIITTNYDDLLEQETKNEFKQFDIIREDKDLPKMRYSSAIIKMHGDFIKDNIVLTETDYFNYPKDFSLIRSFVQAIFANKLVVFIGFSFNDLNLKMILNDIKNILGEKMQRAYLISLTQPDQVILKYFEQRFINIAYLDDKDLNLFMKDIKTGSYEKNKILKLSLFGQKLYNYLTVINRTDFNRASNPISYAWNKLKPYQDEMRVYGRGLKYFLPTYMGEFSWHEHSQGVGTYHPYFNEISKKIQSREGLIEFLKEIGIENLNPLLKLAYYNSIWTLDKLNIFNNKTSSLFENYENSDLTTLFNLFDYKGISNRLTFLSRQEISGKIEDLESGYIYSKIGNYYQAYQEFNKVLSVAWQKNKYILYFICLYNLVKLAHLVKVQLISSKTIDGQAIFYNIKRINLSDVLLKIQIPVEFRKILQDLLADRYLNEHLVDSEKLKEEIHRQRISSENGGSSLNSNIMRLIGINDREDKFHSGNFILSNFNATFEALKRNVVIGILNSHATKDSKDSFWEFGNTKLEILDDKALSVLINSLNFSELNKIFTQYKIKSILIDESGQEYLKKCIQNLKDNSFESFWGEKLRERLNNLLFIISLVKLEGLDIEILYALINWLYNIPISRLDLSYFIIGLIRKNPPSIEIAQTLLDKILSIEKIDDSISKIVIALCEVIANNKTKISLLSKIVDKEMPDYLLRHFGNIMIDDEKEEYFKWSINKLEKDFYVYIWFHDGYNLVPNITNDEFKKKLLSLNLIHQRDFGNVGYLLSKWRKDTKYSELWNIIDDCSNSLPYLKFALSPENYEDKHNINVHWLMTLGKQRVKELIKIPIYNEILLKQIALGNYTAEDRLELLSVYQNDASEQKDLSNN